MKQNRKKTPFWEKVGAVFLEVMGELLVALIFFIIGVGVMVLLEYWDAPETIDSEMLILLGMVLVLALLLIPYSIIIAIRERKKKTESKE